MSKALIAVAFLVLGFACTQALILPGKCQNVTVKPDFDATQYVGKWYNIRSYFTIFQWGLNCSRANYTLLSNGTLRVNNTATAMGHNGKPVATNITGSAYAPDSKVPAKLKLHFDNQPANRTGDYWVVETDYTNFGIVWSCANIAGGLFHEVQSWILGRVPTGFNGDVEKTISAVLAKQNITVAYYNADVQDHCVNV
jgi:lipocalin